MIYHHPLAYLIGVEGRALLRAWGGEGAADRAFVQDRLAEVRRLLADESLANHPGSDIETDATDEAYAQWAPRYDEPGNPLFDLDAPMIDEMVAGLPRGTAVDAACGTGRLTAQLIGHGYRMIGVDSSAAMLDRAREQVPAADFRLGELDGLPLPTGSADLVVTGLALTHVADVKPVYAEFARVLRPGGDLVVSDVHPELTMLGSAPTAVGPDGQPLLAANHRHTIGEQLRAALAAGFTVLRCEELPRPVDTEAPLPEPTTEIGAWSDWPWTLLSLVPDASRVAWNDPAVVVWHFRAGQ